MDEQAPYYFAFSHFHGIGPHHFSYLLNRFPSPQAIFTAPTSKLIPLLGDLLTEKFLTFRSSFDPIAEYTSLLTKGIQYVHIGSSLYPNLLRTISDPPIGLFIVGDIKALNAVDPEKNRFLAIVGTRQPSSYGEEIAKKFAFELASHGFTIVSGMAMGIDSCAHVGALEAQGKTIAVLGCGVDNVPSSRLQLYKRIISSGGAVVSEFVPGEYVKKGYFVTRNRIVSGMSDGVLVIEGTSQSGTLITAQYAASQGKDVFAPPVPITSDLSQAPNILLKQGATLVTDIEDILEEYNLSFHRVKQENMLFGKTTEEQTILKPLLTEPLSPDDLSRKTKFPVVTILTIISMLEIEGLIKKQSDGKYRIIDF